MSAHHKFLVLAIAALLCAFVACGGGDSDGDSPTLAPTSTPLPNPLLADPAAALVGSAQAIAIVSSVRSDFEFSIRREGFEIEGNGTYNLAKSGALELDAHYKGQGTVPSEFREENDSRLVVTSQQVYLKTPPLGDEWVLFTPVEFGPDWDVVQALFLSRSPLDYATITGGVTGPPQDLGDEVLDGRSYRHLRADIDAATVVNGLINAYGSQGQVMLGDRFSGPITLDVWIDPATLLPHSIVSGGVIQYQGADTQVAISAVFREFDTAFVIDLPTDAVPAAELFGG